MPSAYLLQAKITIQEEGALGQRLRSELDLGQEENGVPNHPTKCHLGIEESLHPSSLCAPMVVGLVAGHEGLVMADAVM